MKLYRTTLLLIVIVCYSEFASAQLVNIEAKRMQKDSTRFALKSDVLVNYTDNNGIIFFK